MKENRAFLRGAEENNKAMWGCNNLEKGPGGFKGATTTIFQGIRQLKKGQALIAKVPGVPYPVPVVIWLKNSPTPTPNCGVVWGDINSPAAFADAKAIVLSAEPVETPMPKNKFVLSKLGKREYPIGLRAYSQMVNSNRNYEVK